MDSERLGFAARLWLAFILPWSVLFDAVLAARIARARDGEPARALEPAPTPAPEPAPTPATPAPAPARGPDDTSALQLLGILQREGRLVDFLREDVTGFSDADIGAAARVVHQGCKRALDEYLEIAPVRTEREGDAVVLDPGYDAARTRVTGNVVGQPPFRGQLAHHGWEVTKIELPRVREGFNARVIAPAEVEL